MLLHSWAMKRYALPLLAGTVALLALSTPLPGQLLAARDNSFAVGHHHLNVTDVESHKRFWADLLGGEAAMFGNAHVMKFPNTLLFLREQDPTGESNGSTVNHLGFRVPDLPLPRPVVLQTATAGGSYRTSPAQGDAWRLASPTGRWEECCGVKHPR